MASEAAASGLRFFLDRGLGSLVVPRNLRDAGWTIETMDERYGKSSSQSIQDIQWIEEAALAGDVLLGKDLANAALPGAVMAEWYLAHEAKIIETATRAAGPCVMAVNLTSGLRRARLAFPSS